MWPFIKKKQPPETKPIEDGLKEKIASQLIFDPLTKRLKIKPNKLEPLTTGVEAETKIILECPTCKEKLVKYSVNRFKCPHCRKWIYYRDHTLFTMEEYHRRREEYFRRRQEEWQRQELKEGLESIGLTEKQFLLREQELAKKAGIAPTKISVTMSLFNEFILKVKDQHEQEQKYRNLAIMLNTSGLNVFHILKAGAKAKLAAYKKDGIKNVYLLTGRMCEVCMKLDGQVMTIAKALENMPIPIQTCKNHPYNDDMPFCICSYEPEYE
ncbi:MAG: hypothetical protein PHH18_09185 [Acidobacteriota bacterium]|nr:hypothetical protein [Acidobacteriota bacterium]MDD8030304.1 hypothetical protein [Acidobacteriota bacterium]MDD8039411.1 hypothetical protein [Acidobacteriota bacterium]MDW3228131.1 hypothetical protein [Acidobacteriota bacterium]